MRVALLQLFAIDCTLLAAFVSQRLHVVGTAAPDRRAVLTITLGLLVTGFGLLLMAKGG